MDCTAAAHRIEVGVPATIEHSSEEGVDMAKWVAETTQVRLSYSLSRLAFSHADSVLPFVELHHLHGRSQTQTTSKRSTTSFVDGSDERLYEVQEQQRMGGTTKDLTLVRDNSSRSSLLS